MEELKPCPFCGGEATIKEINDRFYTVCNCECEMYMYKTYTGPSAKKALIKAWNTRQEENNEMS